MILTYAKFSNNEWRQIVALSKNQWTKDAVGQPPTKKAVKKEIGGLSITWVQGVGIVLALFLVAFSSFKLALQSIPFVDSMIETLSHSAAVDPTIQIAIRLVAVAVFASLAGIGLIYYQLLALDPEIKHQRRVTQDYKWLKRLSLDYVTPRLPSLIVYLITIWLVYASWQIEGTIFERLMPVLGELALVHLVAELVRQGNDTRKRVNEVYDLRAGQYTARIEQYATDPTFITVLYAVMREKFIALTRRGVKVNAELETADKELDEALRAEYVRNSGNLPFAEWVLSQSDTPQAGRSTGFTKAKRIPPGGEEIWTTETLFRSVLELNPRLPYKEPHLRQDFEEGYNLIQTWRAGVRDKVNGSHTT